MHPRARESMAGLFCYSLLFASCLLNALLMLGGYRVLLNGETRGTAALVDVNDTSTTYQV